MHAAKQIATSAGPFAFSSARPSVMNTSLATSSPPAPSKAQSLNGNHPVDRLPSQAAEKTPSNPILATKDVPDAASTPKKRGKTKTLVWAVLCLLLVGVGAVAYLRYAGQFEGTDDAYLDGNLHPVSARVNGTVAEVLTDDNRPARAGEPLLRLDPRDFEVALDEAKSNLLSAEAAVPQAEAQVAQARAQLDQAEAMIAQTKAQLDKAVLDLRRADELIKKNVSTQSEDDTANANHEVAIANAASAHANHEAAAAMLRAAEANLQVAVSKRGTAQAAVRDAELQLSYTTVPSPADGHVGKKAVEVGQRVGPGQPLLALVGADNWVVANFKEHQLAHMQAGQTVEITVDAVADHRFVGTVESFSPGTGAKFSLLPPDNATGNFTKIVQRVPVKIRFTPESMRGYEDRLSPGLSAVVRVHVQR